MNDLINTIVYGDCLEVLKRLPDKSVDCCITSPPYWGLRDYGCDGQLGLEKTPEEYVAKMVIVFSEVRRILKTDGTCWLNLGDSYANNGTGGNGATGGRDKSTLQSAMPPIGTTPIKKTIPNGLKPKDLVGIPWRVAFALQADGWWLRQDIIWHKPNPMPESVTDRCTKSHEYIFLMTKSDRYFYDYEAIKEQSIDPESFAGRRKRNAGKMNLTDPNNYKFHGSIGDDGILKSGQKYETRNCRSVWTIPTHSYKEAHFATFPEALILPMVKTTRPDAIILDPFMGAGTTAVVAKKNGRRFIGIELSEKYCEIARGRLMDTHEQKSFLDNL
jgi:DNA modification methylase